MASTLDQLFAFFRTELASGGIEDPAAEARILLGGLFDLSRTDFITGGLRPISDEEMVRAQDALARRMSGEPPFRILGRRGFYGLELRLSNETLEPRPDTEILVDLVLDHVGHGGGVRILDLGTGTGAIALALLSRMDLARATGVDISPGALTTAIENARRNGLEHRFDVLESDWFDAVESKYDVVVSNPPYIRSGDIASLDREVKDFDPSRALDGGEDGLTPYRIIAAQAGNYLSGPAVVAVEYGYDQRLDVENIFLEEGYDLVEFRKDYAGNDRASLFRPSIRIDSEKT